MSESEKSKSHVDLENTAADATPTLARVTSKLSEVALERNFSFLSCLGLAFALLNSWTAMSASLSVVLPSGGSVSMVWGLLVSALGTIAMGLSLAEICHAFPMTGGQYDWAYILAPESLRNGLSFFVGWCAAGGWVAMSAAAWAFIANFVFGILALWQPETETKPWQWFLLYVALAIIPFVLNTFFVRTLPAIDRIGGVWSIIGIVVVSITILACSKGNFQDAKFVFATFYNETGWPNGMAFILGLLQSTFGLTAFDAVTHLIEEMPKPSRNAPKTMVLAIILGAGTSFIFTIILLFVIRDFDSVVTAATGPILQIYYQATSSQAGATCLLLFNLGGMFFSGQAIMTVSSRMVWTVARDQGLGPLSDALKPVHPRLKVPARAIIFVLVWVFVFGLIELGSSIVLNAILSSSVVLLQTSYFFPIFLIFIRGESAFDPAREHIIWSLGRWRRLVNGFALVFVTVTSVVFIFPPAIPVTGASMNYVIVVVGVVLLFSTLTWIFHGRKHYKGPSQIAERLEIAKHA
ncbi:hypothetical protein Q8F55_006325 [Vanrija albida]|uniref:Uncharacterized protein n=1 Tax=Vanrija albida TaxID=181172 RepID=A0ABR3PWR9_9TREE